MKHLIAIKCFPIKKFKVEIFGIKNLTRLKERGIPMIIDESVFFLLTQLPSQGAPQKSKFHLEFSNLSKRLVQVQDSKVVSKT